MSPILSLVSFFFFSLSTERLKEERESRLMSDRSKSCRWNYRTVDREHPTEIRGPSRRHISAANRTRIARTAIDPRGKRAGTSSDFDAGSGVTFGFHSMRLTQKRNDTTRQVSRALRFPISSNTSDINRCLPPSFPRKSTSLCREKDGPPLSPPTFILRDGSDEISDLHYASNRR